MTGAFDFDGRQHMIDGEHFKARKVNTHSDHEDNVSEEDDERH